MAVHIRITVHAEAIATHIGKLDFELDLLDKENVTKLYAGVVLRRACRLYFWALSSPTRRREELGPVARQGVIRLVPPVRGIGGLPRQNVAAVGHREDRMTKDKYGERASGFGRRVSSGEHRLFVASHPTLVTRILWTIGARRLRVEVIRPAQTEEA